MNDHIEATIEADATVPAIHISRDFRATAAQLFRAHTDPEIYARWVGPDGSNVTIVEWNAVSGGNWKFCEREYVFRGCFHDVRPDRIVQTFTWEAQPDDVALETLRFVDVGGGITRLTVTSLVDSFETRDGWLRSGMEVGVDDGYAKLDTIIRHGEF